VILIILSGLKGFISSECTDRHDRVELNQISHQSSDGGDRATGISVSYLNTVVEVEQASMIKRMQSMVTRATYM